MSDDLKTLTHSSSLGTIDSAALMARLAFILGRADHLLACIHQHRDKAGDADLLSRRLAPDMLCLAEQVVVLADSLWGAAAVLSGQMADQVPAAAWVFNRGGDFGQLPDTVDQARQRVDAARRAVEAIARQPLHPSLQQAHRTVVIARPGDCRRFVLHAFVHDYLLPNAYFHLTMIHALLRQAGIPIGKVDFEGPRCYEWTDGSG